MSPRQAASLSHRVRAIFNRIMQLDAQGAWGLQSEQCDKTGCPADQIHF
jgi:hypothetical protein